MQRVLTMIWLKHCSSGAKQQSLTQTFRMCHSTVGHHMLKVIFFLSKTDQGKGVLIVIERQQTIYA
jgi:hypothetical protein